MKGSLFSHAKPKRFAYKNWLIWRDSENSNQGKIDYEKRKYNEKAFVFTE